MSNTKRASHRILQALIARDPDSGMWITYVPTVHGLGTCGSSRDEALRNLRKAALQYRKLAEVKGLQISTKSRLELTDLIV